MKMFALGLMLATTLTAQNVKAASTVFGGTLVSADEKIAKSTVSLIMLGDESMGTCTGTLISKKLILTAAHCMRGIKHVLAVFGNIESVSQLTSEKLQAIGTIPVDSAAVNAGFAASGGRVDDIALLKLRADAPAGFEPVPMATVNPAPGTPVILAGYGNSHDPFSGLSSDDNTLRKIGKTLKLIYGKSLVFDNKGTGVSNGDSGGPAYIEDAAGNLTVVGVTNSGLKAGLVLYASVADYLPWIRSQAISQGEI